MLLKNTAKVRLFYEWTTFLYEKNQKNFYHHRSFLISEFSENRKNEVGSLLDEYARVK